MSSSQRDAGQSLAILAMTSAIKAWGSIPFILQVSMIVQMAVARSPPLRDSANSQLRLPTAAISLSISNPRLELRATRTKGSRRASRRLTSIGKSAGRFDQNGGNYRSDLRSRQPFVGPVRSSRTVSPTAPQSFSRTRSVRASRKRFMHRLAETWILKFC